MCNTSEGRARTTQYTIWQVHAIGTGGVEFTIDFSMFATLVLLFVQGCFAFLFCRESAKLFRVHACLFFASIYTNPFQNLFQRVETRAYTHLFAAPLFIILQKKTRPIIPLT